MSLVNSVVILILPFIVSLVAPDNTESQWTIVFYILAVIVFVAMMFFNFVCEVEPRSWTKLQTESPTENTNQNLSQLVIVRKDSSKSVNKVIDGELHDLEIKPVEENKEDKNNKEADINAIV